MLLSAEKYRVFLLLRCVLLRQYACLVDSNAFNTNALTAEPEKKLPSAEASCIMSRHLAGNNYMAGSGFLQLAFVTQTMCQLDHDLRVYLFQQRNLIHFRECPPVQEQSCA